MDDILKVTVAFLYLDGKANVWFLDYQMSKPHVQWLELIEDICIRFKDVNQGN